MNENVVDESDLSNSLVDTTVDIGPTDIYVCIWRHEENLVKFAEPDRDGPRTAFEVEYIVQVEAVDTEFLPGPDRTSVDEFVDETFCREMPYDPGTLSRAELRQRYQDHPNEGVILGLVFHEQENEKESGSHAESLNQYLAGNVEELATEAESVGESVVMDGFQGEYMEEKQESAEQDGVQCPVDGCISLVTEDTIYDHCLDEHGWWDDSFMDVIENE